MSDQGVISLINGCKRRVPISLDDQGDLLGQVVLKLRPGGGAGLEARNPVRGGEALRPCERLKGAGGSVMGSSVGQMFLLGSKGSDMKKLHFKKVSLAI